MSPKIKKQPSLLSGEIMSVCCENHRKHSKYTAWSKCSSYITASDTCSCHWALNVRFVKSVYSIMASLYEQMGINGLTVGRKDGHSESEWCLRKNFILLQYDVASFGYRIHDFSRQRICLSSMFEIPKKTLDITNVCRWGHCAARNVGIRFPNDATSYCRRRKSAVALLWKPRNWQALSCCKIKNTRDFWWSIRTCRILSGKLERIFFTYI